MAVVGAGAAGLMAAIEAARRGRCREVIALDGARTLGAKILISGGGRCNVTHHAVDETAFAGSTRPAIRKVLRRFDVGRTVEFFAALGVELKREETGKLFPVSDRAPAGLLTKWLPDRLARALCTLAGVAPGRPGHKLTRQERTSLARAVFEMPAPVTGDRGFGYAEVTAGGVPLAEVRLETMESRVCPGLYLCGEICDVDGRIGGFNFQWAWASGYVAGVSVGG